MRLKRLKRKSKFKIWTKKIMISTTLFSTTVLLSAHMVGGTEAIFVSEVEGIGELNSAFVFPATIEEIVNRMNENNKLIHSVLNISDISSVEEGQLLIEQINDLNTIYDSIQSDFQLIEDYYSEVNEKYSGEEVYSFVIEGYEEASLTLDNTEQLFEMKDQIIESILFAIQELQQPEITEETLPTEEPIEQIPEEVIEEPIEVTEEISTEEQPEEVAEVPDLVLGEQPTMEEQTEELDEAIATEENNHVEK